MFKTCYKCKIKKSLHEFHKDKSRNDGCQSGCKECIKESSKKYYDSNQENRKKYSLNYKNNNKQKQNENTKKWREKNKKHINEYDKLYKLKKKNENPIFRIKCNLRSRLSTALKNHQKSGSAIKDLGISIDEFKNYLELKFQARHELE